jgi:hypothetical protein
MVSGWGKRCLAARLSRSRWRLHYAGDIAFICLMRGHNSVDVTVVTDQRIAADRPSMIGIQVAGIRAFPDHDSQPPPCPMMTFGVFCMGGPRTLESI